MHKELIITTTPQETKLAKDEIGDALANLLLWTHEIRTKMVDKPACIS